jgi:phage-related protein (TIGR01555 family)
VTMQWLQPLRMLGDSLYNLISGLGTDKDPRTGARYRFRLLQRNEIEDAYRGDWMARAIIDAPAEDATREWRAWQANQKQIEAIEELEQNLDIPRKTKQALIRARLYGGAALMMGVDDGREPQEPLNLEKVGKDGLKFVVVMNRYELNAGPRIYNVDSPWYTKPEYYSVSTPLFGFFGEPGTVAPGTSTDPLMLTS